MALILNGTGSGFNRSVINDNFQKIADEINNNVLRRDALGSEDNAMRIDLDMNSNRILNLPEPTSQFEPVRLIDLTGEGVINFTPNAAEVLFQGTVDYSANNVEDALEQEAGLRQSLEQRVTFNEGVSDANNLSIGFLADDVNVLQNEMDVVQSRSLSNLVDVNTLSSAKANRAINPTSGHIATLDNEGDLVDSGSSLTDLATATQGNKADTAVQPNDNVSDLTNDAGYLTSIASESIDSLSDVDTSGKSTGRILEFDASGNLIVGDKSATGGTSFIGLSDTPASFTGQSGKVVTVNATEDGLEYTSIDGAGLVDSVFGRIGAVTAQSGDYNSDQITNNSTVGGSSVSDALETVASSVPDVSDKMDKVGTPVLDNFVSQDANGNAKDSGVSASSFASTAQGARADTALQPNDNISELTNDSGFLTAGNLGTAAFRDVTDSRIPTNTSQLLRVQDAGLTGTGTPPKLLAIDATDTPAGKYLVASDSNGTRPDGFSDFGVVEVSIYITGQPMQLYVDTGQRIARRMFISGAWTPWYRILTENYYGKFGVGSIGSSGPLLQDAAESVGSGFYRGTGGSVPNGPDAQAWTSSIIAASSVTGPNFIYQRNTASDNFKTWFGSGRPNDNEVLWTEAWTDINLKRTESRKDTTVGRVLSVGDHGIGLNNNDDQLTDFLDPDLGNGFYAYTNTTLNKPVSTGNNFGTAIIQNRQLSNGQRSIIAFEHSGSVNRAVYYRTLSDTYDSGWQELINSNSLSNKVVTPASYGIVGDGSDETGSLQEMFNDAVGKTVVLEPGATYGLTSVNIPADVTLVAKSAVFEKVAGSSTFGLIINDNFTADNLVLTTPGSGNERGISVQGSRCRIKRAAVISDTVVNGIGFQMTNTFPLVDNVVEELKADGFSTGCYVVGCKRSRLQNVYIESYVVGCYLIDIEDFELDGLFTKTISSFATGGPGENGLLIESATSNNSTNNCHFKRIHIQDSGEHGVRVGGMLTVKSLFFSDVATVNTGAGGAGAGGGSGFKVLMNDIPGTYHENIVVNNLLVEDCSTSGAGIGNFAGITIGLCDGVTMNNVIVKRRGNAFSCWDGLNLYECKNVNITGIQATDCRRWALRIEGGLGANVANLQEDIKISGAVFSCAAGIAEPVILVDTRDTQFNRLSIEADVRRGTRAFEAYEGTLPNPFADCSLEIKYADPESTAGSPPVVNQNVFLLNYKGPWYGTFLVNGKDGSVAQDNDGNFRIRKNDIWTTL